MLKILKMEQYSQPSESMGSTSTEAEGRVYRRGFKRKSPGLTRKCTHIMCEQLRRQESISYSIEGDLFLRKKVINIPPSKIIPILSELSEMFFYFFHRYIPCQFQITCFRLLYFVVEQELQSLEQHEHRFSNIKTISNLSLLSVV